MRKRRRAGINERYPLQLMSCQRQLVDCCNEARSRKEPFTHRTLFNTWNAIVDKYNHEQRMIDAPELKGDGKDGKFSQTWFRDMCRKLDLVSVADGSKETTAVGTRKRSVDDALSTARAVAGGEVEHKDAIGKKNVALRSLK